LPGVPVFHDYAYLGSLQRSAIGFLSSSTANSDARDRYRDSVLRGDGTWMRVAPGGREEPLDESPFRQAQRQIKDLVEELRPKIAQLFPELGGALPFVYGHAVAFPSVGADRLGPLPAEVSQQIVLFGDDLVRLGSRVPEILAYWGSGRRPRCSTKASSPSFASMSCSPLEAALRSGARLELTARRSSD
jgi:hypothetical protein